MQFSKAVLTVKYLGVHFDCHMRRNVHFEQLCTKIRQAIVYRSKRHVRHYKSHKNLYGVNTKCVNVWHNSLAIS